jgi:hypothetical protein
MVHAMLFTVEPVISGADMKYLITLFLSAVVLTAKADTIIDAVTVPANKSTNVAVTYQLRDQTRAALQMTTSLTAEGTGSLVATFALSIDGVNFETVPSLSITNTANGTNSISTITRFDPSCAKAIKLLSVTNSAASPATLSVEIQTSRRN